MLVRDSWAAQEPELRKKALAGYAGARNPAAGPITTLAGPPRQIQFALKLLF